MPNNPLEAVSNVIELKPGHKYLLVFKGSYTAEQLEVFSRQLHAAWDIDVIGVALWAGDELQVIEVPVEGQER